jgi:hypothetical protein
MRRLITALAMATVATPLLAQTPEAKPTPRPAVDGCTIFAPVDIAALPKAQPQSGLLVDAALKARHRDWTPAASADAEVVVDAVDPMSRSRTTVIAEHAGGAWRVSAVKDAAGAAPEAKAVTLSAEDAAIVDSVLSDACFWSTPPILPNDVPLKNGKVAVCYDGVDTILHARSGAKRWDGMQKCRLVGLPYRLAGVLWRATLRPSFSGSAQMTRDAPKPEAKP